MKRKDLAGVHVAVVAADGFEQVELTWPVDALHTHGAQVEVISLRPGSIQGMNLLVPGTQVPVDRTIFTAAARTYDALLLPGGFINPDLLRQSRFVRRFVRAFDLPRQTDSGDLPCAVGVSVGRAGQGTTAHLVARDPGRYSQCRGHLGRSRRGAGRQLGVESRSAGHQAV